MPRSTLDVQVRPHATMNIPAGTVTLTMTPGDPANGHQFSVTGRELLIAQNTETSPKWVKLTAAADAFGRAGNTGNYAIAPGAIAVFAVSPMNVWAHQGNVAYVDVEHAGVLLAAVRYP